MTYCRASLGNNYFLFLFVFDTGCDISPMNIRVIDFRKKKFFKEKYTSTLTHKITVALNSASGHKIKEKGSVTIQSYIDNVPFIIDQI